MKIIQNTPDGFYWTEDKVDGDHTQVLYDSQDDRTTHNRRYKIIRTVNTAVDDYESIIEQDEQGRWLGYVYNTKPELQRKLYDAAGLHNLLTTYESYEKSLDTIVYLQRKRKIKEAIKTIVELYENKMFYKAVEELEQEELTKLRNFGKWVVDVLTYETKD